MSEICSKCGKASREATDQKTWEVIEQTDFKEKQENFSGFPHAETHTVKGWKARKVAGVTSRICPDCTVAIATEVSDQRPKARRNMLNALWVELGLIAITILAFMTDTWAVGLTIVSVIGAIIFFVFLLLLGNLTAEQGIDRAHKEIAQEKVGGMAKKRNLPPEVSFCPGLPDAKGILFCMEPDAWAEISKDFSDTEKRTGWSKFHYLREYGGNSMECSEGEGAEHLSVAHLGVFLDDDKEGNGA